MTAARPRAFPEWPVHLLVWTLLLVKDDVAMRGTPAFQAPGTTAVTAWLLALGYLLINATAFYLPVWLVARPLLTGTPGAGRVALAAGGAAAEFVAHHGRTLRTRVSRVQALPRLRQL